MLASAPSERNPATDGHPDGIVCDKLEVRGRVVRGVEVGEDGVAQPSTHVVERPKDPRWPHIVDEPADDESLRKCPTKGAYPGSAACSVVMIRKALEAVSDARCSRV